LLLLRPAAITPRPVTTIISTTLLTVSSFNVIITTNDIYILQLYILVLGVTGGRGLQYTVGMDDINAMLPREVKRTRKGVVFE
jgi:hypothetical protein